MLTLGTFAVRVEKDEDGPGRGDSAPEPRSDETFSARVSHQCHLLQAGDVRVQRCSEFLYNFNMFMSLRNAYSIVDVMFNKKHVYITLYCTRMNMLLCVINL